MNTVNGNLTLNMIVGITAVVLLMIAAELLYIKFNGRPLKLPSVPREEITIGRGASLKYAVLGDSTAAGLGGDYSQGIAVKTAEFLAKNSRVTYRNFAVSGATYSAVLNSQVDQAASFNPDVVLVSAGANDVTHLTASASVTQDLTTIVEKLRDKNPKIKIIITGSPQMGSIPRFPQPVRYLAKLKTAALNSRLFAAANLLGIAVAPIAAETGPLFQKNPGLFAEDKFHPNNAGYATWIPIINRSLQADLSSTPHGMSPPL